MKELKDYLGLWKYTHASADKLYNVEPKGELYKITWGDSIETLGHNNKATIVDAAEAFRRVRTKVRGGYTLVTPYTGTMPESAALKVEDLYPKPTGRKPKAKTAPKKKFSFLDWVAERK